MAKARIIYLSDSEKDFIHQKTLEVLANVGVAYNTPEAIDILEEAGAQVDRETMRAKLSWELIESCLKTVPDRILLAGRRPEDDRVLGEWPLHTTTDGIQTYVYDDLTGERREGTSADLATFVKLGDALSEVDAIWPSPQASDLDPYSMPVIWQAISIRNTSKHIQDEIREPQLVEPILAMYEAAAGASLRERPIFSVTNCTIAPLQHDRDMTEAALKMVRRGVPIFVLPMPQAGTTGPMTLAGTCIVNMAELLSAVVLFQLAEPGCALVSGVGSAVADMRTGGYISAGPEIGLINMICVEMSKYYGLLTQSTGISADAKAPNFQAGSEGGMTGLCAALVGADSLIATGAFDGVQTESLAKAVLDNDQIGALRRYVREDPIDESTALMADIVEVGIGGHFLGRKSTRAFSRSEVWRPHVFQRGSYEDSSAPGRSLIEEAVERARYLLATHDVAQLPSGADAEIDAILRQHEAALS
ncbi:MAG: trimethylamine methyltransferase family protein [Thermoleophilia bacterium]|nr:trimethylamine methyltransferase family protein [Thermoleophilia bacterium]